MKRFIYLEPYVYKQVENNNFLLYNTLNGKYRTKKNEEELLFIKRFEGQIFNEINNYSDNINLLIKYLLTHHFIDYADSANFYQHSPSLNLNFIEYEYINKSLSDYISELTIFINGLCNQSCSLCPIAYKQFPFCRKYSNNEIEYEKIVEILSNFTPDFLSKIHISGGNILLYSNINSLISFLNEYPSNKEYYIHERNINQDSCKILSNINTENSSIRILFSEAPTEKRLDEIQRILFKYEKLLNWTFVIQNRADIDVVDKFQLSDLNIDLFPLFHKSNKTLFRNNVFVSRRDILSKEKITYQQILEKRHYNTLLFGKVYILNNGNYYANLNSNNIGNIYSSNIVNAINKIVKNKIDVWFMTRDKIDPCRNCIYSAFCPPISNYELFVKKYNMCNVYK